jgi:hypothetical protein
MLVPGEQVEVDDFLTAGHQAVVQRFHTDLADRAERELESLATHDMLRMHLGRLVGRRAAQPREIRSGPWREDHPVKRLAASRPDAELLVDLALLGEGGGGDIGQRRVTVPLDCRLGDEVPAVGVQTPDQSQDHGIAVDCRIPARGEEVGQARARVRDQLPNRRLQARGGHPDGDDRPVTGAGVVAKLAEQAGQAAGQVRPDGGHESTATE